MLYIVIKEGIIFRAVKGLYADQKDCIEAAKQRAREDHDDYHMYRCYIIKPEKEICQKEDFVFNPTKLPPGSYQLQKFYEVNKSTVEEIDNART